jgi:hypothetical protein
LSFYRSCGAIPKARTKKCLITQCVSSPRDVPYLRLKHEYVRLASSDESEWEDGIVKGEDMNRQNADVEK